MDKRLQAAKAARARRNAYLFAHTDSETANSLINSWDAAGVGEVCEEIRDTEIVSREKIFTNSARNKLTEYGNSYALNVLLQIPLVERVCKFAAFDMEEMQKRLSHGFATEELRQRFIDERSRWFAHLKEMMKELRISKETMESFGLNWKECKAFAYQTI